MCLVRFIKECRQIETRKDRVIFSDTPARHFSPYYEAVNKGKSIEWGGIADATDAFNRSSGECRLIRIEVTSNGCTRREIARKNHREQITYL